MQGMPKSSLIQSRRPCFDWLSVWPQSYFVKAYKQSAMLIYCSYLVCFKTAHPTPNHSLSPKIYAVM